MISSQSLQADNRNSRESRLYRSSVGKLIETAQRFGRFDPVDGIRLSSSHGSATVNSGTGSPPDHDLISNEESLQIRYLGFSWQPVDFEAISVVGEYQTPDVISQHTRIRNIPKDYIAPNFMGI